MKSPTQYNQSNFIDNVNIEINLDRIAVMKLDLLPLVFIIWLPPILASEYLNLNQFIKPALEPGSRVEGSAVYENSTIHSDGIGYFGTEKKRKNLKQQDPDAEDLYLAIGVPEQQVKLLLIPIHKFVLKCLDSYFIFRSINLQKLYFCAYDLKQVINWLSDNYLQGISTIVMGTGNKIRGNRIYMKSDDQEVIGQNNFVFNSNYANTKVYGKNIVRVGSYDINLNTIEKIMTQVDKVIKTLQ